MGIHVYLILAMRIITKHSLEQQKHTIKKKKKKSFEPISYSQTQTEKKKKIHRNSEQGKTVQT